MNERDALLRALCENPDEDTPRLVFADWLQENGNESDQARAEFIRAQIELLTHQQYTIPWFKCRKRVDKLLTGFGRLWCAELPSDPAWVYRNEFRRGFVERLNVSDLEVFQKHAARIFTTSPIEVVGFSGELDLCALPRVPRLDRVSEIWGRALHCTPDDVRQLMREFKPTRLKRFVLSDAVYSVEAYRLLEQHFGSVFGLIIV